MLYATGGKRVGLPFLNDHVTPDLSGEVAAMREAWMAGRGEDWQLILDIPEVRRRALTRSRHWTRVAGAAAAVTVSAFMVGLVTFIFSDDSSISENADANGFQAAVFHPLSLLLILPVVALACVIAVGLMRRPE